MDLSIRIDDGDRLRCTIDDGGRTAVLYASDKESALEQLIAALDETSRTGCGECVWPTEFGDYWWTFRRQDDDLLVVALRSGGTLTGWEQLLRAESAFEPFADHVRAAVARARQPT